MNAFTRVTAIALVCLLAVGAAYFAGGPTGGPDTAPSETGDRVAVPAAGVSFQVPAGWATVDRSMLEDVTPDSDEGVTALRGLSEQEVQRLLEQGAELFAWSGGSSITVVVPDQALPAPSAIESQYRALGATDIATTDLATEVGSGFSTSFAIVEDAGQTFGRVIAIAVDDRTLAMIALSASEADTAALGEEIVSSLRRG